MILLLKGNKDSATNSRARAINQIKMILITAPALLPVQHSVLLWSTALLQQLEKEIAELREDLDQLTQQACPGLRKTYGIAVDGAATLLVAAGDNPARLRSDAAFAALSGVSPLPASSGKTNRHRLNRGGNRQANATLHRVVVVRLRWHEQTKAYAARRMEEGRSKPEIMRCLKRFIAREVFHTLLGRPPVRTAAT